MEENYSINYQYSGERENIRIRDKFYSDGSKIFARRGNCDRPVDYEFQEKIRVLNERRIVQKNYGRRLGIN